MTNFKRKTINFTLYEKFVWNITYRKKKILKFFICQYELDDDLENNVCFVM
jgi:hypothetical protein